MMYYPDFSHIFSTLVPVMFSFSSLISLVLYILGSVGLYSMARNTGVRNPWFAWIPIARDFLLGSLADRYNSTAMHKNTSLHLWLTILSGIQTPLFYFLVIIAIVLSPLFYNVPILLLALLLFLFLASLVGIAYKVFYLLSFYYVTSLSLIWAAFCCFCPATTFQWESPADVIPFSQNTMYIRL